MTGHELRGVIEHEAALPGLAVVVVSSYPSAVSEGAAPNPMNVGDLARLVEDLCRAA